MKHWYLIPLAAVIGLIAGSWGPREDLKLLQEKMREAKDVGKASASAGFGAFAKMVNIPDVARRPAKPATNAVSRIAAATNAVDRSAAPTNAVVAKKGPAAESRPNNRRPFDREDLRARIDEASDLWRTRVELARVQWKDKLGITDKEKSAAFDSALASMNEALLESMTAVADEVSRTEKMTPELALRMMGDVSRSMAEAYDAVGETVPPERRGEVSEMPIFDFVDPSVAEPLIGVQDKLGDASLHGGRRP